jgi:hypothetical protein
MKIKGSLMLKTGRAVNVEIRDSEDKNSMLHMLDLERD